MIRSVFVVAFFSCTVCLGQKTDKEFYSAKDEITDEANSLYFKVGVKKDNFFVDSVFSYFTKTHQLRSVELRDQRGQPQGIYVEYFESGNIKEKGFFVEGYRSGQYEVFYSDGKQQYTYEYPGKIPFEKDHADYRIIHYWDSTGNQLIKDGEGLCRCYSELLAVFYAEEGKVSQGFREGKWKSFDGSTLVFEEEYERGVLKKGVRYEEGEKFEYSQVMKMASFPGGLPELGKFISGNLKYPKEARKHKIQGLVYVSFIVRNTGHLDEIKCVNEISPLLRDEAIRVVRLMDAWVPGEMKGKPVNSRFVLPVRFKLE